MVWYGMVRYGRCYLFTPELRQILGRTHNNYTIDVCWSGSAEIQARLLIVLNFIVALDAGVMSKSVNLSICVALTST